MVEPHIQYCTTDDGVDIAYATAGEGLPFLWVPNPPFCHVQKEWEQPVQRAYFDRLATAWTIVRLDPRGLGLSDRRATDFSLESRLRDVEAVVAHLNFAGRFVVTGSFFGGALAVAYAVRHPDQVSHLILLNAFARGADLRASPQMRAMEELLSRDWEMFTENVGGLTFGWGLQEAQRFAEFMAASINADAARLLFAFLAETDVSNLLSLVRTQTLVIHHEGLSYVGTEVTRALAARIPEAHLMLMGGKWLDGVDDIVRAINGFAGQSTGPSIHGEQGVRRMTLTILFTDLTSSTALTQRLGDAKAQELLRAHNTIVREALKAHGGQEIKHTGDGIMASFPSASNALHCAIAIQRAVEGHSVGAHGHAPLQVHIGLNAGEPVAEESDLFGTAVQLARRICDQAEGGEILASDVVRQLAAGKGFFFSDRGDAVLKGFEEPVRRYEVRWREEG